MIPIEIKIKQAIKNLKISKNKVKFCAKNFLWHSKMAGKLRKCVEIFRMLNGRICEAVLSSNVQRLALSEKFNSKTRPNIPNEKAEFIDDSIVCFI
jgi:hypothetical protein